MNGFRKNALQGSYQVTFDEPKSNEDSEKNERKALGTFSSLLQALTNCKVSEKVMNGFRETA